MKIRWLPEAVLDDEDAWKGVTEIAGEIARRANRTSAKIGISYDRLDEPKVVRIGPRGAAAIPVEYGTVDTPAKRYVKKAIDSMRIR